MHLVPQALQAGPDRRGCGDQSLGHTGLSWDFRNLSITYDNLMGFNMFQLSKIWGCVKTYKFNMNYHIRGG